MSRFYDFNALELMEMAPISIFSRNKNTEIFLDDQLLEQERRHCLSVHIFCSKNEMAQGKLRSKEFLIYSFDKTGSPISELGKCADLYVINNVVITFVA